jgi:hypothetical protein
MSNTTNIPYVIKTNGSVTLYLKNECLTVATDHPNYNKIIEAIKTGEFDKIDTLVNVSKAVTQYAKGQITVLNGEVFFGSFPLHNTLTNRILAMMNEGFKFDHMVKFLENLMQNPSNRAVNETYTFLENYGLPITDDGCFLAYKAVRNDYKDIYSGKLDNRVGCAPSMPRNMVDEVYERDCSTGLHVGALDYVVQYGHFVKGAEITEGGNRLLVVKVNPKDVVSVPKYDNHPKMRVSQYLVVSEIKDIVKELDKVVYTSNAETFAPDRSDDEWSEYEDDCDDESDESDCEGNCDSCSCDSKPSTTTKVDTTSSWDEVAYREGYGIGEDDAEFGNEYGENRDYSRENSYRMGYNDGYNQRPNVAEEAEKAKQEEEENNDVEDTEYLAGWNQGRHDLKFGLEYQANLDSDSSDAFKDGYRDGFNY